MRALITQLCVGAMTMLAGCGGGATGETAPAPTTTTTATTTTRVEPAETPDASKLSADLDALGERIGAEVGATMGAPGAPPLVLGSLQSGSAWSTIKVPIALQVIDEAGGVEKLPSSQRADITAAITRSDNEAAARLFEGLVASHGSVAAASQALTDLLREAGDEETVVSTKGRDGFSSYGQTEWSLQAQQTFMGALLNGCVADPGARDFVLAQMSQVTSDTWGLGSAAVPALWKGGWGPGADGRYLVRQMGEIDVDGADLAVTIAAIPGDGAFESGQAAATRVAQWIVEHAPKDAGKPNGC